MPHATSAKGAVAAPSVALKPLRSVFRCILAGVPTCGKGIHPMEIAAAGTMEQDGEIVEAYQCRTCVTMKRPAAPPPLLTRLILAVACLVALGQVAFLLWWLLGRGA